MGVANRDRSRDVVGRVRDDPKTLASLLQPVFEQFAEGSKTADMKAAERLLARLD